MITNNQKRLFFRFLKKNNIYHAFIYNVKYIGIKKRDGVMVDVFLYDRAFQEANNLIIGAFSWARTKEGTSFWLLFHKKWLNELNENKM